MDVWIVESQNAGFDAFEGRECIPMEPPRVDTFAGRQKRSEFAQALAELAARTRWVIALAVVKSYRKVN